ncbi:MAG: YdiU family protein [Bacteriovoracaceae bacterium]|jgi:uncharacterized protein YdiU (UPF0061 family)|nr:YdiU family protein [Bacteriovoracaceae bacterium]
MILFKNTYSKLPKNFFHKNNPSIFPSPKLVCINNDLAKELQIDIENYSKQELARIFSGQTILPGSEPISTVYAGFQFGHPVAQLGDGRAHLLGEINGFDIQLKGSGKSLYSRKGDGKSTLGSVIREYIISEAMHALGIPTTRALCAVITGENIYRQEGLVPGGVLTRVASSHLRVGHFQFFSFNNDHDSLKILLDYTLKRHYPKLLRHQTYREKSIEFLKEVINKQSDLIAKWSSIGFIHGVMNTDNFSVAGITIDYGPCAFMDEFKLKKVFSSIDHHGRYSYFNQVPIAKWNILRLAECLIPLISECEDTAIKIIQEEIVTLLNMFETKRMMFFSKKLGIINYKDSDKKIILTFLEYLEDESLDFTLSFRYLEDLFNNQTDFYPKTAKLETFLKEWKTRVNCVKKLTDVNPIFIPRNHLIQKAIDEANQGNYQYFLKLNKALLSPYKYNNDFEEFLLPPTSQQRVYQTFCGT